MVAEQSDIGRLSAGGVLRSARLAGSTRWQHRAGVDQHHRRRWLLAQGACPSGEGESPCPSLVLGRMPVAPRAAGRAGHTPEREAHGSNVQHSTGNGGAFATASPAEESLEIEEPSWCCSVRANERRHSLRGVPRVFGPPFRGRTVDRK